MATDADLKAAAEATRIFAAASTADGDAARWTDASRCVMRLLIHRIAAERGCDAPPLPVVTPPKPMTAGCRALMRIENVATWSAPEFGPVYEYLLTNAPGKQREKQGSWYTPPLVAEWMARTALDIPLNRFARSEDPGDMLLVLAVAPACGAGIYPLMAARHIATRYARRLFGQAPPEAVRAVMPEVMEECIFGIDIDPIAVELTKAALWLEIDGSEPFGFMDRNVICGNALDRDLPPKLAELQAAARGAVDAP